MDLGEEFVIFGSLGIKLIFERFTNLLSKFGRGNTSFVGGIRLFIALGNKFFKHTINSVSNLVISKISNSIGWSL